MIAFYQITSPSLAPEDVALPPITTPTYAIEFQKAIKASSRGREVLTVQVGSSRGKWPTLAGRTACLLHVTLVVTECCVFEWAELLWLCVMWAFGK